MSVELSHIPIQKVTAFCVRGDELLVFDHPFAGTQVPAGTVETGEDPRDAVAREFTEETGIAEPIVGRCLGVVERNLSSDRAVLLEAVVGADGVEIPRGWTVLLDGAHPGADMAVRYEVWDFDERPPRLVEQRLAMASHRILTRRVRRHFYLVHTDDQRTDPWEHTDEGNTWTLRWAALNADLRLFGEQHDWLTFLP